nr:hypothetical protein [Bacteroidota bacterium]
MKKLIFATLFLVNHSNSLSQGLNHNYLLGYWPYGDPPWTTTGKAIAEIDSINFTIFANARVMKFLLTQSNISDSLGNILFYSNGGWVASADGDTMLNGEELYLGSNPKSYKDLGFANVNSQVILPYPDSSNKYILFHQTASLVNPSFSTELLYTIIDMTLDSGRGAIIQKNTIALSDSLMFGIYACKHANGRDWWLNVLKEVSNEIYTLLLSPAGIDTVFSQHLNVPIHRSWYIQPGAFSPDGNKFAYIVTKNVGNTAIPWVRDLRLFDFDRCNGNFSKVVNFDLQDTFPGIGICFSSNSRFLYTAKYFRISQFDVQASNIEASRQFVADYDTFYYGGVTDFANMYRGANGKIYITSS